MRDAGSLPDTWANMTNLRSFTAHTNKLTGEAGHLPSFSGMAKHSLKTALLRAVARLSCCSSNDMCWTGSLPEWAKMIKLENLDLSFNNLGGKHLSPGLPAP